MDPAALGTLIIGIESVRADQSVDHRRRQRPALRPTNQRTSRTAIASVLRALADRLERPTTQAAPG